MMVKIPYASTPSSKIETRYLYLTPDLRYRCYIFAHKPNDPGSYIYLYMDTEGTYIPTQTGKLSICHTGFSGFSEIIHMYPNRVSITKIQEKIQKILEDIEYIMGDQNYDEQFVSILLNMIDAYIQLETDLKQNIPMHLR